MDKEVVNLTKVFTSNDLTKVKYNEIVDLAKILLEHRIQLSMDFHKNLEEYIKLGKNGYLKHIRATYFKENKLSSNFDHGLCIQVYTNYSNLYNLMFDKMRFVKVESITITKYKRKTKYKKSGDFKGVSRKTKSTDLSITLTHLARHGHSDTVDYINNQLLNTKLKQDKREYYEMILRIINKFGFERLYKLALQHRNRFLKRIKVIEYESLTFVGRSRKKYILDYNKNYNSIINSFISLSWNDRNAKNKTKTKDTSLHIPITFNKTYHGNLNKYKSKSNDYQYVLVLDERRKRVRVNILTEEDRYFDNSIKTNFIGCDANAKHNQFILSDNTSYRTNEDLINEYAKVLSHEQKLKRLDKNHKFGKRHRIKKKQLSKKQGHYTERIVVSAINHLLAIGINHIVMEDIDGHMGKSSSKNKEYGDINYNNLTKFIGLGSLKGVFKRITKRYGIDVSLVQAHYTSIGCSCCGYIDKENRPTQELFKCVECKIELNADLNAALNILFRVTTAVSGALLNKNDNGIYSPIKINREELKSILLSFRTQMPYYNRAEEYRQYLNKILDVLVLS